jgi:hypothetical protein
VNFYHAGKISKFAKSVLLDVVIQIYKYTCLLYQELELRMCTQQISRFARERLGFREIYLNLFSFTESNRVLLRGVYRIGLDMWLALCIGVNGKKSHPSHNFTETNYV